MGNVTSDNLSNTYSYDAEGRAVSLNGKTITYDAFNREVELQTATGYTQVVYAPDGYKFALMNGSTVQRSMAPLTAGLEVVYGPFTGGASQVTFWRHSDWLGTSRMASTPTQAVYYDRAFAPYGEPYAELNNLGRSFTGQTQDAVSGIYDFLFRQQSASQGRWLAPDPAGLAAVDITNPQTWNRYAYVGNNPLSNVDPLGLYCGPGSVADENSESGCSPVPRPLPLDPLSGWGFSNFGTDYGFRGFQIGPAGHGGGARSGTPPPNRPIEKPPALRRSQPQCFAQLKTRLVSYAHLGQVFGATHSFWYVQDSLGNQLTVSGGPEPPDSGQQYLDVWVNDNTNSGADNVSAGTSWNSGTSSANCAGADNLLTSAGMWPQGTIPYAGRGPNSNTVANYLGRTGGFSPPIPSGAWGWNAALPPNVPVLPPLP